MKRHLSNALLLSPTRAIFLLLCLCLACHDVHSFVTPKQPLRRHASSSCQLQIPVEVSSLVPMDTSNNALLEGVSWTDLAIYGGIPLAAISFLASRSPQRLVTPQELEEITAGTFLQSGRRGGADVTCLYKASRDGWSATDFHDKVDNLGSVVVAARSLTGQVFGGYNPAGFRSTDDYVTSTAAFLWAKKKNNNNRIVKFPILAGGNAAVFDYATAGPNFGASDLQIGPPKAAVLGGFAG